MRRFLLAALLVGGLAQAQGRSEPPRDHGEGPPLRWLASLGLAPEQQAAVEAILAAGHAERERIEQGRREAHEALRDKVHAQVAEVLDAEQLARFDAEMAERRPPRPSGEGRDRRRRDHGPDREHRNGPGRSGDDAPPPPRDTGD